MNDEKTRELIGQVKDLFMRYGIKSLTMDDISRELKMSKKTLYQHVSDKQDLVKKVMNGFCSAEEEIISTIAENYENPIDELIEISKYVISQLQQVHPSIHYDLEKYYPEAWQGFHQHKQGFIYGCVKDNMEKGIKLGLYRSNINTSIVAKFYISRIDMVFDPDIFPVHEYRFTEVYLELVRYHIRGIASREGMKYLAEKIKKEKLNFYG